MPALSPEECGGKNIAAFLDTIAWSEIGARQLAVTDDGYNVIVGSTVDRPILMQTYRDHPNRLIRLNDKLSSTAAGRYQILYRFWVHYKRLLRLPDFSPRSQDKYAIHIIKERGAYNLILNGMFYVGINRCANIWASFPGANYGQHEQKIGLLAAAYKRAGGVIAVT